MFCGRRGSGSVPSLGPVSLGAWRGAGRAWASGRRGLPCRWWGEHPAHVCAALGATPGPLPGAPRLPGEAVGCGLRPRRVPIRTASEGGTGQGPAWEGGEARKGQAVRAGGGHTTARAGDSHSLSVCPPHRPACPVGWPKLLPGGRAIGTYRGDPLPGACRRSSRAWSPAWPPPAGGRQMSI